MASRLLPVDDAPSRPRRGGRRRRRLTLPLRALLLPALLLALPAPPAQALEPWPWLQAASWLARLPAPEPQDDSAGWEPFVLAKTAEELAATRPPERPLAAARGPQPVPPPATQPFRFAAAVGYVQDADFGLELSADGVLRGLDTRLDAFLTQGAEGLRFESGLLHLQGERAGVGRGWRFAAGDLVSDLWGRARGVRLEESGSWWSGSVSWYGTGDHVGNREALVALRPEVRPTRTTVFGGEATSDGSWAVDGRWSDTRGGLAAWLREDAGGRERDGRGLSGYLRLPAGASLQGSAAFDEGVGSVDRWSLALRGGGPGPLRLSAETVRSEGEARRSAVDSVGVELPTRHLRLRLRYARRSNELLDLGLEQVQDELLAGVTAHGRRFRLDYQGTSLWLENGESRRADFLSASWTPRRGTRLEAFAVLSEAFADDRVRLRAEQALGPRTSLVAEYGNVSPYQALSLRDDRDDPGDQRFRLLIRRAWDLETAARGGRVEGRVRDPWGGGAAGIAVRLGPWVALTGDGGTYVFEPVPAGAYELTLVESTVPANVLPAEARTVVVAGAEPLRQDLALVPLGTVRGRVEIGAPGAGEGRSEGRSDGRFARRGGEGAAVPPVTGVGAGGGSAWAADESAEPHPAAGLVVLLGDAATVTRPDGSFAFGNVPPGTYALRLAADRLPADLEAAVPSQVTVGLPAGRSVDGVVLRGQVRSKAVVFREVP